MKFRPSHLALLVALGSAAFSAPTTDAQDLLKQFPVKGGSPKMAGHSSAKKSSKKRGVPQAKVALKGAFPTVPAAQTKGALDAKNLVAAQKMVGKNVQVVGTVTKVFAPPSGSIVLLNFAADYKKALVGVVKAKDFAKFPRCKT